MYQLLLSGTEEGFTWNFDCTGWTLNFGYGLDFDPWKITSIRKCCLDGFLVVSQDGNLLFACFSAINIL